MRDALGATLAALRAYRRVAQVTSQRLVKHDRADIDALAITGVEEYSGNPPRSQARRSLVALGAASMLAVAGLVAAAVAVLNLSEGAQPGRPSTVIAPYGAVPAATSSAARSSGTATGRAPTDPRSAGSTAESSPPSASVAAAGSTASAGTRASAASAAPTDTAQATASPSLLDLCRSVVAAGNSWPSALRGADRETVVAAAGTTKNVLPYCTAMIGNRSTT